MQRSFSRLTGRVCGWTQKTVVHAEHGGVAARPKVLCSQRAEAAICTMGVRGGMLRDNLEMSVHVEKNATLMVDSTMPVRLVPHHKPGFEYGIGIHASAESGSLLVIAPAGHVPSKEAIAGLWTRYDLSPNASLVSVQLADLKDQVDRPPQLGGRYTVRTRVHHTVDQSSVDNRSAMDKTAGELDSSLAYKHCVERAEKLVEEHRRSQDGREGSAFNERRMHVNESCVQPSVSSCGLPFSADPSWVCDWTFGRRFSGLTMGTPTTNVIASVIMTGKRAQQVVDRFKSIDGVADTHLKLGFLGQVHLAIQDVSLRSGDLVVARVGSESKEDMHRLLHYCLQPLEDQLGYRPYARHIHAASTAQPAIEPPVFHIPDQGSRQQSHGMIHVQHCAVEAQA